MINLTLEENNTKLLEQAMQQEMDLSIDHFTRCIAAIRTGRAHPSMLEGVNVSCYEGTSEMKLKDLASITALDANMLVVQPWDAGTLVDIEKAIRESDLGVNPQSDAGMIRIKLPAMTSERRDELVKNLHKELESCKIAIRNMRKEFHNLIRDSQRSKKISEDFSNRLGDIMQKITDSYIEKANAISEKKQSEIKGK